MTRRSAAVAPADRRPRGARFGLVAWSAGLVLSGRALLWLGAGSLSIPVTSPGEVPRWAAETPAPEMAVAVLRAGGLAACAYLLAVTVAGVLARRLRLRTVTAALDRLTPALARRLVVGGSSAGLMMGALAGSVPLSGVVGRSAATVATDASPAPGAAATMVGEEPGHRAGADGRAGPSATMTGLAPAATSTVDEDAAGSATMIGVGSPPVARADPVPAAQVPSRHAASPAPPGLPDLDPSSWEVAPGDSLWSIAEEVVLAGAPDAGERAVAGYWRRLVEANRARLVDPDNPDLLVPGQRLVLP